MRWYLSRAGVVEGPFEEHAVVEMIRAGQVSEHAYVAPDGGTAWQPIGSHPPFASARSPSAAAPGVPATIAMDGREIAALVGGAAGPAPAAPAAQAPVGMPPPVAPAIPAAAPASAPAVAGGVDPRPGTMLPRKKSVSVLPLAAMGLFVLCTLCAAFSFVQTRMHARSYRHSAEEDRRLAREAAPDESERYLRMVPFDERIASKYERQMRMWCGATGVGVLMVSAMFGLFLVLRRRVKMQHAEVDRLIAARKAAGLDPMSGQPPASASPSSGSPAGGPPRPRPRGRLDSFIYAEVEPRLRPGETIKAVGSVQRFPRYNMLKNPVGSPQHFLAAATDQRLILMKTEATGLFANGALKAENRGAEVWEYEDLQAVQAKWFGGFHNAMGVSLIPKPGRGPHGGSAKRVDIPSRTDGCDEQSRLCREFPMWLATRVAPAAT